MSAIVLESVLTCPRCGHCVIQTTTCDPPKRYEQHPSCCWIGGHFTEPNEQKTQQSPGLGRSSALQLLHS